MKIIKKLFCAVLSVLLVVCIFALSVNFYVIFSAGQQIVDIEQIEDFGNVDAVLVLGCGIIDQNTPSDMLRERLEFGVKALNHCGKKTKLMLSGDNSGKEYNEVAVMKKVSLKLGADKKQIVEDGNGFSTFESVFNAAKKFGFKKIIIVTQSYHLPRALFIAEKIGLEAYGVKAYLRKYPKQIIWSSREVLARNKDFLKVFHLKQKGVI